MMPPTRAQRIYRRLFADLPEEEKLFGKSEWAPLWGDTSQQNGARSTLIAALRYQRHAIQTRLAIYQTVFTGSSVNRGHKEGQEHSRRGRRTSISLARMQSGEDVVVLGDLPRCCVRLQSVTYLCEVRMREIAAWR